MTLGRTGLGARTARSTPYALLFSRDRNDGGGGGDDGGDDHDDDVDDTGTDDDDPDPDDPDDDDGDPDDEDDAPLKDAGKKALKAEREKNKRLRAQVRELRNGKPDPDADDGKDKPDPEAAKAAALELAKPVIIRSAATAALKDAGLIGEPGRLVKLLDLKSIDVELDDDGEPEIDGLEDQISELVEDYPQLFVKKRTGPGNINGADKSRRSDGGKPKSATERQAELLRRRSR